MVRAEVVRKCLNKLDEYLAILHGLRKYTFEEFIVCYGLGALGVLQVLACMTVVVHLVLLFQSD